MRKRIETVGRVCARCEANSGQIGGGFTARGEQRFLCKVCNYKYSFNKKPQAYSKEIQEIAIREYYSGVSARGIAKIHKMHHSNVLRWIKKNSSSVDKSSD